MEQRRIGASGLWVSALGLGCNNFGMRLDAAGSAAVVRAALDAGITHFDTAESYGRTDHQGASEEYLGRALAGHRDDVVVATKFGSPSLPSPYPSGGSRRYVAQAVERSLRNLGTEWIDLYYLHYWDPATPILETLSALTDLVRVGKVRYLGVSNLAAWQLVHAAHVAAGAGLEPFVAVQAEWSLLRRSVEGEMVPAAAHLGVGVVPFFPLASGLLTGKYRAGEDAPAGTRFGELPRFVAGLSARDWEVAARVAAWADAHGRTPGDAALAWLVARQEVGGVLAGATTPEQVVANAASASWVLDDAERADLDALTVGAPSGS